MISGHQNLPGRKRSTVEFFKVLSMKTGQLKEGLWLLKGSEGEKL